MSSDGVVRILAISGSLRAASSNSALVRAAAALAPPGVDVSIYTGLGDLPPFNPDDDTEPGPAAVADFRVRLQATDAVLISSPEYAHGVPGVLKNALDWLVGSGELIEKPVALINASASATYAHASLAETVTVMTARLIPEASITVPLSGRRLDMAGMCADATISAALTSALQSLASAARAAAAANVARR